MGNDFTTPSFDTLPLEPSSRQAIVAQEVFQISERDDCSQLLSHFRFEKNAIDCEYLYHKMRLHQTAQFGSKDGLSCLFLDGFQEKGDLTTERLPFNTNRFKILLNFYVDQTEEQILFTIGSKSQWLGVNLTRDSRKKDSFLVHILLSKMSTNVWCTVDTEPFQLAYGRWHNFCLTWTAASISIVSRQCRTIDVKLDGVQMDLIDVPDWLDLDNFDRILGTYTDFMFSNPLTGKTFKGYVCNLKIHDLTIAVPGRRETFLRYLPTAAVAEILNASNPPGSRKPVVPGPATVTGLNLTPLTTVRPQYLRQANEVGGVSVTIGTPSGRALTETAAAVSTQEHIPTVSSNTIVQSAIIIADAPDILVAPITNSLPTHPSIPSTTPSALPQPYRLVQLPPPVEMINLAITDLRNFKTTEIMVDDNCTVEELVKRVSNMYDVMSMQTGKGPDHIDHSRVRLWSFGRLLIDRSAPLTQYQLSNNSVLEFDLRP